MRSLEERAISTIGKIINYSLSKIVKPDIQIDKVTQLDTKMIDKIKQEYGIEGIILDVDDTLRKNMKQIPKCNQEWIDAIKGQLKIIIVSNGMDKQIEEFFSQKGIDYIGFAKKPLNKNFKKACEKLDVDPEKMLVIGDNLLCDIHGGKKNNMKTAWVKNVEDEVLE